MPHAIVVFAFEKQLRLGLQVGLSRRQRRSAMGNAVQTLRGVDDIPLSYCETRFGHPVFLMFLVILPCLAHARPSRDT